MFSVYFCLAQGLSLFGYNTPSYIYRCWLVEGFAFFMLGHWIHEHQNDINISNRPLLWILVVSTLLCLLERYLMGCDFGVNICSIPQVFALFVYAVKNPESHAGFIQKLGKECSMLVYILHPAVWHSLDGVYSIFGIGDSLLALYLKPIFVVGISVLLAMAFNWVRSVVNRKKQLA